MSVAPAVPRAPPNRLPPLGDPRSASERAPAAAPAPARTRSRRSRRSLSQLASLHPAPPIPAEKVFQQPSQRRGSLLSFLRSPQRAAGRDPRSLSRRSFSRRSEPERSDTSRHEVRFEAPTGRSPLLKALLPAEVPVDQALAWHLTAGLVAAGGVCVAAAAVGHAAMGQLDVAVEQASCLGVLGGVAWGCRSQTALARAALAALAAAAAFEELALGHAAGVRAFLVLLALLAPVLLETQGPPEARGAGALLFAGFQALNFGEASGAHPSAAPWAARGAVMALCAAMACWAAALANTHRDGQRSREQKRLERSRQRARRLERAGDQSMAFLVVMSHELRTPLNAVIGMSDLLLTMLSDTQQEEIAALIKSSAGALLSVINDVLDFSRATEGQLKLVQAPVDLGGVVAGVLRSLAPSASGKGIDLVSEVCLPATHVVLADETRLRQVVTNLTGNAIKFTAAGHVKVRVSVDLDDFEYEIAVSDTGCGIPAEKLGAIFEPFTQVNRTMRREADGTGLGLAICKNIVGAMGGKLAVESRVDHGTAFFVRVPLTVVSSSSPPLAAGPGAPGDVAIVAEFSDVTALAMQATLGAMGVHARIAETPARALELQPPPATAVVLYSEPERTAAMHAQLSGAVPAVVVAATAFQRTDPDVRRLLLPLVPAELLKAVQPAAAAAPAPAKLERRHSQLLRDTRVLVAEDNVVNVKVVRRMLERLGCEPTIVENGALAVDALREAAPGHFQLCFMDLHMPVMDGFAAARAIRELGITTPIIALTADAFESARTSSAAAGMDGLLTKPIVLDDLRKTICGVVGQLE